jgi:dephospho-CoA kinase
VSNRPFLIGLTGPIACGKTTVARMLAELGGTVIDADVLARRATSPGEATLPRIRERFGESVFAADGSLDRAALADLVFNDPAALADLERIVHPEVRRLVGAELGEAARENVPFAVIEAIKLVEGGLAERCDEVWLVDCSAQTQLERLTARGLAQRDAQQRINSQGEQLTDRLAAALAGRTGVRRLSTDGSLEQTRELVEETLADALEPLMLED